MSETKIIETNLGEKFQRSCDLAVRIDGFEKFHRFGSGHFQNIVDRFVLDLDFKDGGAEARSIALRAAQEKVAKELHFHFFKTQTTAAVAPSGAGIEGKCGSGKPGIKGCFG